MQAKKEIEEYLDNTLVNKLIESKVPQACKQNQCILGIDEAGRGPVLGPMSYAIAYYPQKGESTLATMKFADSKKLTEPEREKLFEAVQCGADGFQDLGYAIKIISPNMISNSMLRRNKYNLNALSHDTAIDLIRRIESQGIGIAHVYIDTVGDPMKYKEKLQKFFPKVHFTVTEKADSKYPIVSAASVCAKVSRDRIVQNWRYLEDSSLRLDTFKLGSGYPADPDTKSFLTKCIDPVFGFPILARFSWSTITRALESNACKCDWNEPELDEAAVADPKQLAKQQNFMKGFFRPAPKAIPSSSLSANAKTKTSSNSKAQTSAGTERSTLAPRTNADAFFQDRSLARVIVWNL